MSISYKKYLLLDKRIIDKTENAVLTIGKAEKDSKNPLFGEDKPWEVRFDNLYPNVIYDKEEQIYKCWYSPFIIHPPEEDTPKHKRDTVDWKKLKMFPREMAVCYAFSKDGINWKKPELDLISFNGFKKNNIVLRRQLEINDGGVHGAGILRDDHDADRNKLYKMIFRNGMKNFSISFSKDGLNWGDILSCGKVDATSDTHNNVLWIPKINKYVAFTRLWRNVNSEVTYPDSEKNCNTPRKLIRIIARSESSDFTSWEKAEKVLEGSCEEKQTYSMVVFPYADTYLGLVTIHDQNTDLVHCELAHSPDTKQWNRICKGSAFLPLGKKGSYDCGCIYPAATPVILNDEIRIYYLGSNGPHTDWRDGFFCLATLRKDGFAGYEPKDKNKTGTIITQSFKLNCNTVKISADVKKQGFVVISILDNNNKIVSTSESIYSSVTESNIIFNKTANDLTNKKVKLKIEFSSAKIFSFDI